MPQVNLKAVLYLNNINNTKEIYMNEVKNDAKKNEVVVGNKVVGQDPDAAIRSDLKRQGDTTQSAGTGD